ncbi:MAG TPA: ABC transporter ATP-binding protein [Gemmatimonadaceae bacterium]|nr:ABC transporter ATP-binding protein [Gemmatimonadaceae bacterium]
MQAVVDVSLDIAPGEVLGIAGPNGAGKSTLLALLLGFLRPTRGAITIEGLAPRAYVERHGVSYLPEVMALPVHWTTRGALTRLAVLAGVPRGRVRIEVERLMDEMQIGEHQKKRLRALSKGNYQRMGLAQALLTDTRVVIFDEPTNGLDPVWTQRFRDIVEGLRRADRAIIIASHNLDELERLTDRVAIVDKGRIQRVVGMGGAMGMDAMAYLVRVQAGVEALLAQFPGAEPGPNGEVALPPVDTAALNAGLAAAIAAGALVSAVIPRESALEQAFHSVVGGAP